MLSSAAITVDKQSTPKHKRKYLAHMIRLSNARHAQGTVARSTLCLSADDKESLLKLQKAARNTMDGWISHYTVEPIHYPAIAHTPQSHSYIESLLLFVATAALYVGTFPLKPSEANDWFGQTLELSFLESFFHFLLASSWNFDFFNFHFEIILVLSCTANTQIAPTANDWHDKKNDERKQFKVYKLCKMRPHTARIENGKLFNREEPIARRNNENSRETVCVARRHRIAFHHKLSATHKSAQIAKMSARLYYYR